MALDYCYFGCKVFTKQQGSTKFIGAFLSGLILPSTLLVITVQKFRY